MRRPARVQCRGDGGRQPGPLGGRQLPVSTQGGEELTARSTAATIIGGGFLGRFGCNHRTRSAQGWCQYGSPAELPGIKHKLEYDKDPPPPPDWRITCLFVDKRHRGQGIARAALEGALDQIAHLGGGLVEAISEVTTGREAQGRFLFSATVELFEQNGFTRVRQVGKHAWIVSGVIEPT
jgi:GNAT superfamily N-acetyltransferase